MKRILSTLKEKWPEYLLEGCVIVVSILLAIWLENRNEERQDGEKRVQYIHRLTAENQEDLRVFEDQMTFLRQAIRSIEDFTLALNAEDVKDEALVEAASRYFQYGSISPVFNISTAAFNDLSSTGNLRVFKDDSLRGQLVKYYEYSELVKERLEINNQWSVTLDGPFQVKHTIMQFEPSTRGFFSQQNPSELADQLRSNKHDYLNNAAVHYWVDQDAMDQIQQLVPLTEQLIVSLQKSISK